MEVEVEVEVASRSGGLVWSRGGTTTKVTGTRTGRRQGREGGR